MGTSNFLNKNASKIFAVSEENSEFLKADLVTALKKDSSFYAYEQYDSERNYSDISLGEFGLRLESSSISISPIIRSGYYEGVNLDFEIQIKDFQGEPWDSFEELASYLLESEELKFKRDFQQLKKFQRETIKKLEKIFAEFSDHKLKVLARFSNGETMYCEA